MPLSNSRHYFTHNTVQWLTLVYTSVIFYASLHPLTALRLGNSPPWAFLILPWTWVGLTFFDVITNIVAYAPLGFGLVWILPWRVSRYSLLICGVQCVILATLLGATLSLGIEILQTYSPVRVASTLDIACNSMGTLLGAGLGAGFKGRNFRFNNTFFSYLTPQGGAIWAVVGLWSLAQLNPQGWAFMTAPLLQLTNTWLPMQTQGLVIALTATELHNLEFVACIVALISVLSLVRLGLHRELSVLRRGVCLLLALIGVLMWQVLAYWLQFGNAGWDLLFSAAVVEALICVMVVLIAWTVLPVPVVAVSAVLLLVIHTVLAQMLPAHPYTANSVIWQQARLKHLHGLTTMVSALWPFLALAALVLQSRYRQPKSHLLIAERESNY